MSKSKAKSINTNGVTTDQASLIHNLLGECFETSLRQQLMVGEFNAAILGRVLDYLKHNNISVVEEADSHLASLAATFRNDDSNNLFNFLDRIDEVEYH